VDDNILWFAGVDWASEIHQVVLVDARGTVTGERTFPHGGEGLGAMCDWILSTTLARAESVAPVTRRSGKRCVVVMRQACHMRLRTAVYHWARVAIQHDELSKRRYRELRKRGHSHGRALRTVADRLLAVACAMLRARTTFDPAKARALKEAA
jgi:hypothetical protein